MLIWKYTHAFSDRMATLNSGQHLKALIAQAGHTLTDIAPKIGYTREHLSRLINAGHVDELLVWKVSNAIGVDLVAVMFPAKKITNVIFRVRRNGIC